MATHCGISRQSLGFYLSGKRFPDIVSLCKISEETGHSIDWIVFGKPDEKSIKDFSASVEELVVVEELDGWVKISIEEGDGYVSKEFVNLRTDFVHAESKEEEEERKRICIFLLSFLIFYDFNILLTFIITFFV